MSDFPQAASLVTPLSYHSFGMQTATAEVAKIAVVGGGVSSITWVANQAIFIPFVNPTPYPVRRVFWVNGSAVTVNADLGIYNGDGTKIYSTGSTVTSGASGLQFVDATDFVLPEGRYWLAWASDGTTNVVTGNTTFTTVAQRLSGVLQQATAFALPATMASAGAATQAIYPLFGITRSTTLL